MELSDPFIPLPRFRRGSRAEYNYTPLIIFRKNKKQQAEEKKVETKVEEKKEESPAKVEEGK